MIAPHKGMQQTNAAWQDGAAFAADAQRSADLMERDRMNAGAERRIYHIVATSELSRCMRDDSYEPASLESDGFVHCSGTPAQVLEVANAFFSAVPDQVLVLEVELARLKSRVVWEPAAPVGGQGMQEADGQLFPHVYGPVNLDAVSGVGVLRDGGQGFTWPATWSPLMRRSAAEE